MDIHGVNFRRNRKVSFDPYRKVNYATVAGRNVLPLFEWVLNCLPCHLQRRISSVLGIPALWSGLLTAEKAMVQEPAQIEWERQVNIMCSLQVAAGRSIFLPLCKFLIHHKPGRLLEYAKCWPCL